ncbi:hypothetical protein [Salegentibacter chungangensis]|uniref:Uncharacterized protein n=1 Tax=Salegentibacter chungangensis TaxID=1335724 RepID=A0ABW3NTA7_9FLAO
MKTLKYYLAFTAVFALLLTSCSKDETQMVDNPVSDEVAVLTFGPVLNDMLNRAQVRQDAPACSENAPAYAQISLTYGASNTPVDVVVEILSDDDGLFTAYDEALEIPIPSGETSVAVTLTDFLVWDDDNGSPGSVIWAAPKEGSEYAQFVEDPLDMTWDLRAGTKKYVDVEVICFDDREVNLYGYQFFDIIPEVLYELCFFANYCSDSGRHYTANYNLNVWYGDPDNGGTLIYEGLMPATGNTEDDDSGDWYADPLCIAVPGPQDGEGADTPYLYYELTLADWPGSYGTAGDHMMSGSLSWNEVDMLLGDDGTSVEYEHVFINCGDDGGNGNGGDTDADNDGVTDDIDECPNTPADTDVNEVGCPDSDGDGVYDNNDLCEDTAEGVNVNADGCEDTDDDGIADINENEGCVNDPDPNCGETSDCTLDAPDAGCDTVYLDGTNGGQDFLEITSNSDLFTVSGYDGAITISLIDGNPVVIVEAADPDQIKVEVAQTLDGEVHCQVVNADPDASPEAEIVFGSLNYSLPYYIKVSGTFCQN